MKLDDIFDVDLFVDRVAEGYITVRPHEGKPLLIANYSDKAQFSNVWDDVTLNCRGLIYDDDFNVIARPWKKFFNLGDAKAPHIGFDDLVEVTDKMDGSLGILYVHNGKPSIATRGSFHSTQAEWATRRIRQIDNADDLLLENASLYTFLFEIIFPENRIVVDYGKFEGLVLLGAVEIATGHAVGPNAAAALLEWTDLTTEVMPYKSISDVLGAPDRENTEGYVIRAGNKMVKWKRPDYVELHRLISNLSEKSVWSGLEGGKTVEELIEGLPDEFHGFVRETSARLLDAFRVRSINIKTAFAHIYSRLSSEVDMSAKRGRKEFALAIKNRDDKKFLFALLDGKDIAPMIWAELKPRGDDETLGR